MGDMNARLVQKMDANGDGVVDGSEFSEHFEQALPKDAKQFNVVVGQFMEVAQACRERKEKKRAHQPSSNGTAEAGSVATNTPGRGGSSRGSGVHGDRRAQQPSPVRAQRPVSAASTMRSPAAAAASPASTKDAAESAKEAKAARVQKLVKVFDVFDLDGSGSIESRELLQLGQMRRRLGQKQGEWSEDMNARLVQKMDANGDGLISASEFSEHFEQALPSPSSEFNVILRQFMQVALV